MTIEIRDDEKRVRGEFVETVVRDTTRVGHPPAASVFDGATVFVVPENPEFPVKRCDSVAEAIGYVERIIPEEHRGF